MPLAAQVDRFEVASVRAKGSPEALPLIAVEPDGRFVAPNSTLRELVRTAYGIDDNRIVSGPDWMNRERFAIDVPRRTDNKVGQSGPCHKPVTRLRHCIRRRLR